MQQDIPAWIDGALQPVDKIDVHRRGLKHPAVSVFLVAGDRLLIQRRALGKYHTPGLWANTCCTHPHWGESALDCAHRRVAQELGIEGVTLEHRGVVEYRARVATADEGVAMTEHEVVDLFLGRSDAPLTATPDPAEVMDTRWITLPDLHAEIAARPADFTPWLRIYLSDHAEQVLPGL